MYHLRVKMSQNIIICHKFIYQCVLNCKELVVFITTLSACCVASRRTWACQGRLLEKMDQLRRWFGSNSCIPQHILTICFKHALSQIKWHQSWMKKYIYPHSTDAVICILGLHFPIMYAGDEYLAEEPLILPLPAGSRSPCHLWCPEGRLGPVSPVASQGNFTSD